MAVISGIVDYADRNPVRDTWFPSLATAPAFDHGRMERGVLKWDDVGVCDPPTADFERLDDERAQPIRQRDDPYAAASAVVSSQLTADLPITGRDFLDDHEKISTAEINDLGPLFSPSWKTPRSIAEWGISHRSDRRQGRKIFPLNADPRTFRAARPIAPAPRSRPR